MQRRKKWILIASCILIVSCIWLTFFYGSGQKSTVVKFQDGTVYRGKTEKGKLVSGVLRFKNGDTYTGTFKDGRFEGRGVYRSHEGWTFKGIFHRGVAQGQGKLLKDGKSKSRNNSNKTNNQNIIISRVL